MLYDVLKIIKVTIYSYTHKRDLRFMADIIDLKRLNILAYIVIPSISVGKNKLTIHNYTYFHISFQLNLEKYCAMMWVIFFICMKCRGHSDLNNLF